ncbi:MAG: transcriptional regulator [Chthoniobacterales bacterium]|nr:transcriptional regulator [Chthoniobacterales bacterium]
MPFESLISSPGRLQILTSLAEQTPQDFVELRRRTQMTDGNLSTHARRLASAGLVNVRKAIRDARPVTTLELTSTGRGALEQHVHRLLAALQGTSFSALEESRQLPMSEEPVFTTADSEDDWVD